MADEYDVFLSHNSADAAVVEEIAVRLREAGLEPFLDRWDLIPGELWITALERALEGSNTVAVFLGLEGIGPWHEQEKLVALASSARKHKKRVIPVLLPGAREEELGGFLDLRTRVDLAEDDGFERLIAGITGQAPRLVKGSKLGPESSRRPQVPQSVRREIIDFTLERSRHKHFFGREDVLGEMDAWVAARDSGWLLVTGSPGLGKSALMDRWLRRREAVESLTAFHFIRRGHLDWAEPQVVQRNLAAQIEVMFPEQRDAEADPTYRLEQLLGRVSPVLIERNERLVLLVDGLDEAMTLGTASKDNPVPKIFPLELPDRVFVVTASRPRYPHLSWLEHRTGPFEKLALDDRVESNEGAVRAYWAALGPAMTSPLTDELMQAAIRGAEGNLLHAVKLRELWSKPGVVRTAKGSRGASRGWSTSCGSGRSSYPRPNASWCATGWRSSVRRGNRCRCMSSRSCSSGRRTRPETSSSRRRRAMLSRFESDTGVIVIDCERSALVVRGREALRHSDRATTAPAPHTP
jgi:TIR domain/NACHT domain